jgi:hypothetical protein
VLWHGFDDPQLSCQPRGWTGQDLTTQVYAHVTPANTWVVNNGFVNMQTRAFWFGTDSVAAPATVANWVKGFGYDNGWSQRLTSPTFPLAANPGATLRFDVSMELDRSLDTPATNTFTPFGLASGAVANDLLAVEAKKTDGSWAFLKGRFSLNGGPASWEQTPPLFVNRYCDEHVRAQRDRERRQWQRLRRRSWQSPHSKVQPLGPVPAVVRQPRRDERGAGAANGLCRGGFPELGGRR